MLKPEILQSKIFTDERGSLEVFGASAVYPFEYTQELLGKSKKNVFRGMHAQLSTEPQRKLIKVVKGSIIDFVINIDLSSKDFLREYHFNLSDKINSYLYIPENHLHGYLSLEDNTIVAYKVTGNYDPDKEINVSPLSSLLSVINYLPENIIQSFKDENSIKVGSEDELKSMLSKA